VTDYSPHKNSLPTINLSEPAEKLEDPVIPHNYHRQDPVSGQDFSGGFRGRRLSKILDFTLFL
jgi:hypothetical protein